MREVIVEIKLNSFTFPKIKSMSQKSFSPGLRASSYIARWGSGCVRISGPDIVRLWGKATQRGWKLSSPTVR